MRRTKFVSTYGACIIHMIIVRFARSRGLSKILYEFTVSKKKNLCTRVRSKGRKKKL